MYLKSKLSKRLKSGIILLSLIIPTNITILNNLAMDDHGQETYSSCEIIDEGSTYSDTEDGSTELVSEAGSDKLNDDEDIGDLITKYFADIVNVPKYILEYITSTPKLDDHVNDVGHGA